MSVQPAVLPAVVPPPVAHAAERATAAFTTTPAAMLDLTRRIGLALAVLTTAGDADTARHHAVQVLLTGCTDDAVDLAH